MGGIDRGGTRRRFLSLAGAASLAGLPPTGFSPAEAAPAGDAGPLAPPSAAPLGRLAAEAGLLWGVAYDNTILADDPRHAGGGNAFFAPHAAAYRALIAAEAPTILPIGSAFKFDALFRAPPTDGTGAGPDGRGAYDLARDIVAHHAAPARLPVRVDCLIWNTETTPGFWLGHPETFLRDPSSAAERRRAGRSILQGAIEASFARLKAWQAEFGYPLVHSVGVVNEPLNGYAAATLCRGPGCWGNPDLMVEGGGARGPDLDRLIPPGPWSNLLGPDYVVEAFRAATRANRGLGAKLFLNEAWCESDRTGPAQRRALLALLRYLLDQPGVEVDAVGLQCHLQPPWMDAPAVDLGEGRAAGARWAGFVAFLRELAGLVPEIYLTELDVNDCLLAAEPGFAARDRHVARYHGSFLEAVLAVPAVRMVTHWGLSDAFNGMYEVRPDAARAGNLADLLPPDPTRPGSTCPVATAPSARIPGGILRPDLYGRTYADGVVARENAPKPARDAVRDALRRHRGRA